MAALPENIDTLAKEVAGVMSELWSADKHQEAEKIFTPDAKIHFCGMTMEGIKMVVDYAKLMREIMPDLGVEVKKVIAGGTSEKLSLMYETKFTGTNTHNTQGIVPTGKGFEWYCLVLCHFQDKKCFDMRIAFDMDDKVNEEISDQIFGLIFP